MKNILPGFFLTVLLIISGIVVIACRPENPGKPVKPSDRAVILNLTDAEKILGQKAHLTDSTWKMEGEALVFNSTFSANSIDQASGKTGNIYFMFEEYPDSAAAGNIYASIKESNSNNQGIKVLNDMGDEAYFHSDSENFCFILIRKGSLMIRMKVNKLTSLTSMDDFMSVSKKLASVL